MEIKYRGEHKVKLNVKKDDIEFQAVDWRAYNIKSEEDNVSEHSSSEEENEDGKKPYYDNSKYLIRCFGVTNCSQSVCINITGFQPYFYVSCDESVDWDKHSLGRLENYIKGNISNEHKHNVVKCEYVFRKKFYMFTNEKEFRFIKITFKNQGAMRKCSFMFGKPIMIPSISRKKIKYDLYESNIEPFVRFIHERELKPTGWIKLEKGTYTTSAESTCQIEATVDWSKVNYVDSTNIAPLVVASFDIECVSEDGSFPDPKRKGDKVIQIGTTVNYYGQKHCFLKHIITLGKSKTIDGAIVECYNTEKAVLLAWAKFIQRLDPDIITGYNIWGFDDHYLYDRAELLNCVKNFCKLGRIKANPSKMEEKKLSSSALGDNFLHILDMEGRVQIDLLKYVQKEFKLESYKLDFVASNFMKGRISKIECLGNDGKAVDKDYVLDHVVEEDEIYNLRCYVKTLDGINVNYHISISIDGEKIEDDKKFRVINVCESMEHTYFDIEVDDKYFDYHQVLTNSCEWCENKVDLSPKELFANFRSGSTQEIKDIAVYCIQDCELCNRLMNKLEVITNNVGMSNVCYVPFTWLFTRGQGVKIFSLVSRMCRELGILIKLVKKPEDQEDDSYEGAIVLVATPGIYYDPISVVDYASLYPSSMISENISHDTVVWLKQYNTAGELINMIGNETYDNLDDYNYENIEYDTFVKEKDEKVITGKMVCRFAEKKSGEKGTVPQILRQLLGARKATRVKQKTEKDPFRWNILEGLQLAYKITANSLYGQIGAATSPICFKELAACTTATGRRLLTFARDHTEENYPGAVCVYGDTDSIFVNFTKYIKKTLGLKLEGKELLAKSIELCIEAGKRVSDKLKPPHDLEYEKTFYPFIQLAKKRYIGLLYEHDVNKCSQKNMGVVLKRRDNAPICKDVYQGLVHIILHEHDTHKAIEYFKDRVQGLLAGDVHMKKLVITKSLRAEYKNPESIAHKVLADRMGERDPGNKPGASDRIPYVYVQIRRAKNDEEREQLSETVDRIYVDGVTVLRDDVFKKAKQGDRIEHPDFIKEKGLKPDYRYYLERQVMVPCTQLFSLVLEELDGYKASWIDPVKKRLNTREGEELKGAKFEKKMGELRQKETEKLLLGCFIRKDDNAKKGNQEITKFFPAVAKTPKTDWEKKKAEIVEEGKFVEETKVVKKTESFEDIMKKKRELAKHSAINVLKKPKGLRKSKVL